MSFTRMKGAGSRDKYFLKASKIKSLFYLQCKWFINVQTASEAGSESAFLPAIDRFLHCLSAICSHIYHVYISKQASEQVLGSKRVTPRIFKIGKSIKQGKTLIFILENISTTQKRKFVLYNNIISRHSPFTKRERRRSRENIIFKVHRLLS